MNYLFPNMKLTFLPERGHHLVEIDLAGADAQVVAWRSGDEDLKQAFRNKIKIHIHNGLAIFGRDKMYRTDPKGKSEPYYTQVKRGVHLTNYGGKPAAMARKCGMGIEEARDFQKNWFALHPAVGPITRIGSWHNNIDMQLQKDRTIYNAFGYRIPYMSRPNEVFTEALAWEPQSTVAEVTFIAMRRIRKLLYPDVRLKMQVHDSLVINIPTRKLHASLTRLYDLLHNIVIPFDDPLIIPWGMKISDRSWGDAEEKDWNEYINIAA
jgi:DNA polymerase I-like protein with 3'-5' exonuclease and polymerase domains